MDLANGDTLAGATAALTLTTDTTQSYGAETDAAGRFILTGVPVGAYRLEVTYLGYQTYTEQLNLTADTDLGRIGLRLNGIRLEDVMVQGQRNPVETKGDTTQFNASAFKTHEDATTEDLIRKMPGVQVVNGEVQAQGETVQKVLVDGKPFMGNDPKAALKNLPAQTVDKVQVYDEKSEQSRFTGFDDGERTRTMNIITKPAFRNGTMGRVYAGGGTDDRYDAGAIINHMKNQTRFFVIGQMNNINSQNFAISDLVGGSTSPMFMMGRGGRGPGGVNMGGGGGNVSNLSDFLVQQQSGISTTNALGLNLTDQWGKNLAVAGSYFFNETRTDAVQTTRRQYIVPGDTGQLYLENKSSYTRNINHRATLRMDWTLDSMNSFMFEPRITWQSSGGSSSQLAGTTDRELQLNDQINSRSTDLRATNIVGYALWRHKFNKIGRTLSIEGEVEYKPTNGTSNLQNYNRYYQPTLVSDTLDQGRRLDQIGWHYEVDIDYTEKVGKNGQVLIDYEWEHHNNTSDQRTLNRVEGSSAVMDTSLSNVFDNTYTTHTPGIGYRWSKDKWEVNTGVRYKWAVLEGDQTFPQAYDIRQDWGQWLPYLRTQYKINKTTNWRFNYFARTNMPTISQLQNVVDNSNPLQLRTGNPGLKQEYEHRVMTMFNKVDPKKGKFFFAMLNMGMTKDYMGSETVVARADTVVQGVALSAGQQLRRPVSLDGYRNLRAMISWSTPLDSFKYNISFRMGTSYSRTPGMTNGVLNYSQAPTYTLGLGFSSNISKNLDFNLESNGNLSYSYNSLSTQLNTQYYYHSTMGRLRWQFWKGFFIETEATHNLYTGLGEDFNQNFVLWNGAVGKKFGKAQNTELKVSGYDLLNVNSSVNRTVTDIYLEDVTTRVLRQYFLCTLTWKFSTFKKGQEPEGPNKQLLRMMPPPPGTAPGGPPR